MISPQGFPAARLAGEVHQPHRNHPTTPRRAQEPEVAGAQGCHPIRHYLPPPHARPYGRWSCRPQDRPYPRYLSTALPARDRAGTTKQHIGNHGPGVPLGQQQNNVRSPAHTGTGPFAVRLQQGLTLGAGHVNAGGHCFTLQLCRDLTHREILGVKHFPFTVGLLRSRS
jgi:hypothetical protein